MSENKSSNGNKRAKRDSQPGAAQGGVRITAQGEVGESRSDLVASAQPATETAIVTSPAGPVVQPPTAQASIVPVPSMNGQVIEDEFGGVGEGFEGAHASDNVMPAVSLMQGGNPEVKERKAKDGDFMIKMTGQVIDGQKGFLFLPVYYHRKFNHWNNRKDKGGNGGGFIRTYDDNDPEVMKRTGGGPVFGPLPVDETPGSATQLVETKTLFGLLVDEETGSGQMVTIPCESSKLKAFNSAVSSMQQYRHPGRGKLNTYNFMLRVKTGTETDRKSGQMYSALKIVPANGTLKESLVSAKSHPELFEMARALHADIVAGRKKAEEMQVGANGEADGNDTGDADRGRYTGQPNGNDQDIPF
jgi:hypothetical protein